jgi:thiosulfate reductase cytochrome b subunit
MRTHSYFIRLAHWLAMAVIAVMILSGIEIFRAFPSFSSKLPEPVAIPVPPKIGLGGWLGGALKWHLAFAWLLSLTALLSAIDLARGGWRRIRISREELAGVLPMVRYYLFRRPRPIIHELYNPLQKVAYVSTYGTGILAIVTGLLLAQPVQLGACLLAASWTWQAVRILHFLTMLAFLAFIPGHVVMVAISGLSTLMSMVTGEPAERR